MKSKLPVIRSASAMALATRQFFTEWMHQPKTVITYRKENIFIENVIANFRKISMHRQQLQSLDKFLLKSRTSSKQISPEQKRQRIDVEDKERDSPEGIMEGDSPSKQELAPLSTMSYVLSE